MGQVSLYQNNRDTKGFDPVTVHDIYENIKSSESWANYALNIRSLTYGSDEYKAAKDKLPAFTLSGVFPMNQRLNESIISHSGRLCIDVDGLADNVLDVKDTLAADPFTEAVFLSVGGKGLAVSVKIDGKRHEESYIALETYYKTKYGLYIDKSCKNVARIRYVTSDPDIFINWNSQLFEIGDIFVPDAFNAPVSGFDKKVQRTVAQEIIRRGVKIVEDAARGEVHNSIMRAAEMGGGYIAGGLVDEFEFKEALIGSILRKPKAQSRKYEEKKVDDGIKHGKGKPITKLMVDPSKANNKPTTYKDYGVDWKKLTDKEAEAYKEVLALSHSHNRAGDPIKFVLDWLKEFSKVNSNVNYEKAVTVVKKVYELNKIFFNFDRKKKVEKTEILIADRWEFRYNVVTNIVDFRKKGSEAFEPVKIENIYRFIQYQDLKYSMADLKHLLNSDFVEDYDPMVNYFQNLGDWDGVDYIGQLASHVKVTKQEYFASMLKKHLVRSVKCGLGRGVNRFIFTIVGEKQSTGKTYLLRWLCPFKNDYYTEATISAKDKDTKIALAKNFMYNIDELASLRKMDIDALKSLISLMKINERLPYGQSSVTMFRRANFWASTNNMNFLTDTENTRWLVFELEDIDRAYSTTINVNDIWRQAYALYKDPSFDDQLTKEEENEQAKVNTDFNYQSIEEEAIKKHFKVVKNEGEGSFYSTLDIISRLTDSYPKSNFKVAQTSVAMKNLGFLYGQKRINGKRQRGYYAEMITGNYTSDTCATNGNTLF